MKSSHPPPRVGRLHVLTDTTLQTRFPLLDLARRVLAGGADTLQYREKRDLPFAERCRAAEALAELCRGAGARLIVDDHVEVAARVGAGVHLGPKDLSPAAARARLGERAILGGTVNTEAHCRALATAPLDYLGIGPIRATRSKERPAPTIGVAGFQALAALRPDLPAVAIGSVRPEDVAELVASGAHGVAVLGAVTATKDPEAATRKFVRALEASGCAPVRDVPEET